MRVGEEGANPLASTNRLALLAINTTHSLIFSPSSLSSHHC